MFRINPGGFTNPGGNLTGISDLGNASGGNASNGSNFHTHRPNGHHHGPDKVSQELAEFNKILDAQGVS